MKLSANEIKDILQNNGENSIKDATTRQRNLVQKLQERLEELGEVDNYNEQNLSKKMAEIFAKNKPLYLSEHAKDKCIAFKNVTIVNNSQKSGMLVRGGIADRSDMLRLDIFSKANEKGANKGKVQYFGVPIYAYQAYDDELPKSINADKTKLIDETYTFCFSLHKDSFIRVVEKSSKISEGYYTGFDIATGVVCFDTHDKSQFLRKSIQNLQSFEKKHIDILGKCYNIEKHPPRLPIKRAKKTK
jgi:hypothetical protein